MNIVAIHLVAKAHYSGHVIQNDGGKANYKFMRQSDGSFVRKYENLDRTEVDRRGKTIQPELERFNRELGDLIEGRRAWPTEIRFITAEVPVKGSSPENKSPAVSSVPGIPATLAQELLAEYVRIMGEKSGVPVPVGEVSVTIIRDMRNYDFDEGIGFKVKIGDRIARQAIVIHERLSGSLHEEIRGKSLAALASYFHKPDSRLIVDDNHLVGNELPLFLNTDGSVSIAPMDGSEPAATVSAFAPEPYGPMEYGGEMKMLSVQQESQSQVATGADRSHKPVEASSILAPATPPDSANPPREAHVTVPWTQLPEVNASMNYHVLKKIARGEGAWRDDLKGNAAVVQAINDARAVKSAQLATA